MGSRHLVLGVTMILLLGLVVSPFAIFAGAIWLSDRTHEFGPYDPRYFLLVSGTAVGRLGVLAPEHGSISYAARGQDGNSPAHAYVTFKTQLEPAQVIEAYRSRCHALRLMTKDHAAAAARLECNGSAGDEIGIDAERRGSVTDVSLGGWVF
jgi:hypothetical protein